MKRLSLLFVVTLAGTASANTYLDNKRTVTHDCDKDPEALITGNKNTITFTGACTAIVAAGNENKLTIASVQRLELQGNENTVTADAGGAISASGNRNTATFKKGTSMKPPKVSSPGTGNKIGAAK